MSRSAALCFDDVAFLDLEDCVKAGWSFTFSESCSKDTHASNRELRFGSSQEHVPGSLSKIS